MAGRLRIGVTREDDGTGELFVRFEAQGFSGHSSAWFDLAAIKAAVGEFSAFPLNAEAPPSIKGGYWNKDGTCVEQEHVYVSAKPIGHTGNVALLVRLTTPVENSGSQELGFSLSGNLKASYEQLAEFAEGLKRLLDGSIEEVVLCEQT